MHDFLTESTENTEERINSFSEINTLRELCALCENFSSVFTPSLFFTFKNDFFLNYEYMQRLSDYLNSIPENFNKEEIYKEALPLLVEEKFLDVLTQKITYKEFHSKLFELAKLPHGIGLGVSLMAQVNIAGKVLQVSSTLENSPAIPILRELVQGKQIVSLGVSEPDWKGRLSNLKSTLILQPSGKYLLNCEKSFFTNGYHSNYYLVVVKLDQTYKVLLLDKAKEGMLITKFTLPFAAEATHCKIQFKDVEIDKTEILDFDYSKFAENLRLSEMLSLAAIFSGYAQGILDKIKTNEKFVEILKEDETKQKKLLRCKTLLDLFKARILEISEAKDNYPNLQLKEYFPYGTELVSEEFYSILSEILPKEEIEIYFHDKQLFQYRDMLNESYIRRAAKTAAGILKSRD